MSKPNKDGWIRHRGGKCPVYDGVLVEVRNRAGDIALKDGDSCTSVSWHWSHDKHPGDIMAYKIHKPAEQPAPVSEPVERKCDGRACEMPDAESHSKECLLDAAIDQGWAGPIQWRDRITEIDRTVEALEEERVSLIQRLEGEGFKLIDQVNAKIAEAAQAHEDMSDWRNWKAGDVLVCKTDEWPNVYTNGRSYKVKRVEDAGPLVFDDCGESSTCQLSEADSRKFQWYSRPSA